MSKRNHAKNLIAPRRKLLLVSIAVSTLTLVSSVAFFVRPVGDRPFQNWLERDPLRAQSPDPSEPTDVNRPVSAINLAPLRRSNSADQEAVNRLIEKRDTRADDWSSEFASEAAAQQLTRVAMLLARAQSIDAADVETLLAAEFTCDELRPDAPVIYQVDRITVRRLSDPPTTSGKYRGAAGLIRALRALARGAGKPSAKLKLFRIERQAGGIQTHVRYESRHLGSTASRQQTATWICRWRMLETAAELPRLEEILLKDYEEVEIKIPHGVLLVDCTESVLRSNDSYQRQVVPGVDYWLTRIPREFLGPFGHHGIAIGDANGDDLDDLYVCDAGGLPNRLYVQQPDGTAVDVSAQAGVNLLDDSVAALFVDLDNDDDQDLVVGTDPLLRVAENDGQGQFAWRGAIRVDTDSFSLSAADYDIDGDLDLYVCGYNVRKQDPTRRGLPFPLPYHDANNGGRNVLLRNDGAFRFQDVTAGSGLDQNNTRFSMAAAWEDFDNDGDLDLYVANDFGRNNLFQNTGGRFADIAAAAGVEDHASGMSVDWADYNRDGWMDLYVGNMFSAAGNRVTYQRRFSEGLPELTVNRLRRMARGNSLFANASQGGTPQFRDLSIQAHVAMGRWAWGSKFVDLTNSGWSDLLVANGYVTGDDKRDL